MQTLHIISTPKGTNAASFGTTSLATRDCAVSADNELAQPWLLASLQWMNYNSPTDWQEKGKVRRLLEQPLTQGAALQLQQHLIQQIQEADMEAKQALRMSITQTLRSCPNLFTETHYGKQELNSIWSVVTSKDATWARLSTEYTRVKEAVDIWWHTQGLVESAIVDSEKLQRDVRRSARDPNMTADDEQAAVQQLVSKLFRSLGDPESDYPLLNTFQHLHEAILDTKAPKQLAATMLEAVAAHVRR